MLAATGVIWAAVYMLWMLQRVLFGTVVNPENAKLRDLNARELGLLIPLLILMLFMGVAPRPFLDRSKASVEAVRARVGAPPTGGSFASNTLIIPISDSHVVSDTSKPAPSSQKVNE